MSIRPSSLADARDHGGDRGFVGDVGDDGYRLDAAVPEFGDRGVRLRLIAPDHRDVGAGFRQPARHAEPDAAIAAGDDSHLAGEIEEFCCHCCSLSSCPACAGYPRCVLFLDVMFKDVDGRDKPGHDASSVGPARSGSGRPRPARRRSRPTGVWLIMKLDAARRSRRCPGRSRAVRSRGRGNQRSEAILRMDLPRCR